MKVCPLCGENYHTFVDFCFADGEVLTVQDAALDVPEPANFDAPPPPKMMQGSQRAGYTRSATPVPRARRPGRSLITRATTPGYSAPAEEPQAEPTAIHSEVQPEPVRAANTSGSDTLVPYGNDQAEELLAAAEPIAAEPEPEPAAPTHDPSAAPQHAQSGPATPPAQSASEVRRHREEADGVSEDEDEDEEKAAMWMPLVIGGGLLAVVVVGGAAVFALGTMFRGTEDPGDGTHIVRPTLPQPAVQPEPEAPAPQPDVQPGQPEPVAPEPAEPIQVGVVPDAPVPEPAVDPEPGGNDGVAVVAPEPAGDPGAIFFTTDPDRATLYVNNRPVGNTPYRYPSFLQGKTYQVKLEKEGFETWVGEYTITQAALNAPTVKLTPVGGAAPEPAPVVPDPAPGAPEPEPVAPEPAPVAPEPVTATAPDPAPAPVPAPAPEPPPAGPPTKVMFVMQGRSGDAFKVNGASKGSLPLMVPLAPGTYTISVGASGNGPALTKTVSVPQQGGVFLAKLHEL